MSAGRNAFYRAATPSGGRRSTLRDQVVGVSFDDRRYDADRAWRSHPDPSLLAVGGAARAPQQPTAPSQVDAEQLLAHQQDFAVAQLLFLQHAHERAVRAAEVGDEHLPLLVAESRLFQV